MYKGLLVLAAMLALCAVCAIHSMHRGGPSQVRRHPKFSSTGDNYQTTWHGCYDLRPQPQYNFSTVVLDYTLQGLGLLGQGLNLSRLG
jgi:hypothetical protein